MTDLFTILAPLVIGALILTVLRYRNLYLVSEAKRINYITEQSKKQLLAHFHATKGE